MIRTAAKFGAFVAVCLGLTLWLAFTIGNISLFRDRYELSASFEDVSGLLVDDNVKIAGVVVGKVTGIDVDEGRAVVTMSVDDDVRIPSDSGASIRWRNLLGQRYVYLEPGQASTTLTDGELITETTSVVDLGELFDRLGPIVAELDPAQVNVFLDTVAGALSGREDDLRQTIDDLALLAQALGERDVAIGRLIENLEVVTGTIADRDRQIRQMLDNLVLIARTFSENTDVVDEAIAELGDLGEDLSFLLVGNRDEIDRIVASLTVVVDAAERRRPELDAVLADLDTGSAAVFRAGSYGEWLNQVILCAATGPPPCPSPIVKGTEAATGARALTELLGAGG